MLFKGQSYTHRQVNGRSHIFCTSFTAKALAKGICDVIGQKRWPALDGGTSVELFHPVLILSHGNPLKEFMIQPEKSGFSKDYEPLFFSFDELKRLICQLVSHQSRTKHFISDLLLFFF